MGMTMKPGVLNDSLQFVAFVLEDHPEISMERLREIAASSEKVQDREAKRALILDLAGIAEEIPPSAAAR